MLKNWEKPGDEAILVLFVPDIGQQSVHCVQIHSAGCGFTLIFALLAFTVFGEQQGHNSTRVTLVSPASPFGETRVTLRVAVLARSASHYSYPVQSRKPDHSHRSAGCIA